MSTMKPSKVPGASQVGRRVKYSLNVVVAGAAAVGIVILVNWIAHRHFVRFDLTATRRYSLSKQTVNVLRSMDEGHRIVTLFGDTGLYIEQAGDLVDEYGRLGPRLTVEHIDPARDVGRVERFYQSLYERYKDRLSPVRQAVEQARSVLERFRVDAGQVRGSLLTLLETPGLPEGEFKQFVLGVAQVFARLDTQLREVSRQTDQDLQHPLPDLGQARERLGAILTELDDKLLSVMAERFAVAGRDPGMPDAVKDRLLGLTSRCDEVRESIRTTAETIRSAGDSQVYDRLRAQLSSLNPVVLIGPRGVQVLAVSEMFREPDPGRLQPGQQPQLRFQGEEKITGALVGMTLEHKPLVVFLTTDPSGALGPRGGYQQVAQRLGNVDFRVEQWNPAGRAGPMGQRMPPGPAPEPQEGQQRVWVVLPSPPPDPASPMAAAVEQQVTDRVEQALQEGEPVLMILSASPMARYGVPSRMTELVKPWGITPQLDRVVFRQVELPDRQTRIVGQHDMDQWPTDLPITRALTGMPGVFAFASPLVLGGGDGQGGRVWPLAEVEGPDVWAERDFQSDQPPKLDPANAGGPFVVAAAAEKDGHRLVVVSDPVWATDQVTNLGPGGLPAEVLGAAFPANAELFVNSIYWLTHLDQLIAASARVQDIRRIEAISRGGLYGLGWGLLIGLPGVTAASGLGVWLVRRRG